MRTTVSACDTPARRAPRQAMPGLRRALAIVVMLLGYAIIAVPTGIVTMELTRSALPVSTQACPSCGIGGHEFGAKFCRRCGTPL